MEELFKTGSYLRLGLSASVGNFSIKDSGGSIEMIDPTKPLGTISLRLKFSGFSLKQPLETAKVVPAIE